MIGRITPLAAFRKTHATQLRTTAAHRQVRAVPLVHPQRGMVLVTALLLLVVVTLLAVGMFRSFGLDEKIAGNVREKQRALSAAETAEQFAEFWLSSGHSSTGTACAAGPFLTSATPQICTAATMLATPATLPWPIGVNYTYGRTAALTMNVTGNSPVPGSFYAAPAFSIAYLGTTSTGALYQIDAVGYGGSPDTAAVVEATYAISSSTQCKSCGQ
jgi:type IV pilus assembly protein PilX